MSSKKVFIKALKIKRVRKHKQISRDCSKWLSFSKVHLAPSNLLCQSLSRIDRLTMNIGLPKPWDNTKTIVAIIRQIIYHLPLQSLKMMDKGHLFSLTTQIKAR